MAAMTTLAMLALAVLLGIGLYQLTTPAPAMIGGGVVLAAAAPLGFLLWQARFVGAGHRNHPVLISVLSGFGCVMTMFGVYRYGDQFQWLLICALAALCIWMLWQRYVWRAPSG